MTQGREKLDSVRVLKDSDTRVNSPHSSKKRSELVAVKEIRDRCDSLPPPPPPTSTLPVE